VRALCFYNSNGFPGLVDTVEPEPWRLDVTIGRCRDAASGGVLPAVSRSVFTCGADLDSVTR